MPTIGTERWSGNRVFLSSKSRRNFLIKLHIFICNRKRHTTLFADFCFYEMFVWWDGVHNRMMINQLFLCCNTPHNTLFQVFLGNRLSSSLSDTCHTLSHITSSDFSGPSYPSVSGLDVYEVLVSYAFYRTPVLV